VTHRSAVLVSVAVLCAAFAKMVSASGEPAPWRWWTDPAIVGEIGLESRQSLQIERAQTETRRTRAAIAAALRERRTELGDLLGRTAVDRRAAARLIGEIERLQRRQLRAVVHARLRVRRILRPDQLARLLAQHPMLMRQAWEPPFRGAAPTFGVAPMPDR